MDGIRIGYHAFATAMLLPWLLGLVLGCNGVVQDGVADYKTYSVERPTIEFGLVPLAERSGAKRIAPIITSRDHGAPQYGDRLVAVNGVDVRERPWPEISGLFNASGDVTSLTLESNSQPRRVVSLSRSRRAFGIMNAVGSLSFSMYFLIRLLFSSASGAFIIGVGVFLFIKRGREPIATLFSLGMVLYPSRGFPEWALHRGVDLDTSALGVGLIEVALLLSSGSRLRRNHLTLFAVLILASTVVRAGVSYKDSWLSSVALFLPIAVVSLEFYRSRHKAETTVERQQRKWIITGALFAGLTLSLLQLVDIYQPFHVNYHENLLYNLARDALRGIAPAAFCVGVLVALLRYRLYDVEVFFGNTVTYVLLTVAAAVSFSLLDRLLSSISQGSTSATNQLISGGIALVLISAFLGPVQEGIKYWVKRRFQGGLTELREEIPLLIMDLRELGDLQRLVSEPCRRAKSAVRAARLALLLREHGEAEVVEAVGITGSEVLTWYEDRLTSRPGPGVDARDAIFPVRISIESSDGAGVGLLLIGPRGDGSLIGKDEHSGLAAMCRNLGTAIEIVRKRLAREVELEGRIQELQLRLSEAEAVTSRGRPATPSQNIP